MTGFDPDFDPGPDVGDAGRDAAPSAYPPGAVPTPAEGSALTEIRSLAYALATLVVALNGVAVAIGHFQTHEQVQVAIDRTEDNRAGIEKVGAKAEATHRDVAETHELVKSDIAVQLEINRSTTRRLADLTGDPADKEAAALAEKKYRDYKAQHGPREGP